MSVYNSLYNQTCHGNHFPFSGSPARAPGAAGALYVARLCSSAVDVGLATVMTDNGPELFNKTAGLVLNEVQYSTLSIRGLGSANGNSFGDPDPTKPAMYPGWGVIMQSNINSCTVVQLHCEGSGGCVLIDGQGKIIERQYTPHLRTVGLCVQNDSS